MRIQHNILASGAYRKYSKNVSSLKKNLEKLSSGYKINRAGDDAAGLAISEQMRALITGLDTAEMNAKDGISLVQTAEGALTEVHNILDRMIELAIQSANGTYDDATDRAQLQKEMDQLTAEIDRIADSSNFNGINLLDGSISTSVVTIAGSARIIDSVYTIGTASELTGTRTFLDGEVGTPETKTEFTVNFTGLTARFGGIADDEAPTGSYTDAADDAPGTQVQAFAACNFTSNGGVGESVNSVKHTRLTVGGCTISLADLEIVATTPWTNAYDKITAAITTQIDAWNDAQAAQGADYDKMKDITFSTGTNGYGLKVDFNTNTQTWNPSSDMYFTFKIGGAQFTGAKVADGGDETAIATAVVDALDDAKETAQINGKDVVKINGNNYSYVDNGDGTITFTLEDTPTEDNIAANFDWDVKGKGSNTFDGNHTAGVIVTTPGAAHKDAPVANTVFRLEEGDIQDGTKITIDGTTVTLAVGKYSRISTSESGVIDLKHMEEGSIDMDRAISTISEGFASGTTNFIVGVNNTANGDTHKGLTVHKNENSEETYDTKAKLAGIFSIEKDAGGSLRLQIGDSGDSYNQLKVSINDCHVAALGLSGISIAVQDSAAKAVDAIRASISYISDIRGTLGATQNRLDHTINNLSIMTENIQDAESTIRDVDIAEEMMAYTKNNILIQSAQAMLAQANQVPQGVLQLLQ